MYHLCTNLLKNINNYNELREHEIIKNPLNISICRTLTSYNENQLLPKYIFFILFLHSSLFIYGKSVNKNLISVRSDYVSCNHEII